ncbi:hypothetical protein [Conexibacter sp. DBS9H8]|uniref:hypothetical protein n=1 Tax=Conexibacter sp. DBS9H8 TaxID=2937801 RepID=UPI00200E3B02|nr:hypothetical protein [Conexibacter sp. DBS9H8]
MLTLVLALPAVALAAAPPFHVAVSAPTHTPLTCTNWDITVHVTRGRERLAGRVTHYDFLFDGQNVSGSQRAGDRANHYGDFRDGIFRDVLVFPTAAQNEPLTLQVWVNTRFGQRVAGSFAVRPKANPHRQCKVNGH